MKYPEVPLTFVSSIPITNGLGEAAAEGEQNWARYIRTTDIASLFSLDNSKRVTLPPAVSAKAMLEPGDILMTAAGSLGTSYSFDGHEPACYAGYLVRFRPDPTRLVGRFAAYWTLSQHHLDQIETGAVRSTIDNYSAGKFRQTRIPLPTLEEQRQIADFLDDQTTRIDQIIAARMTQQRLLRATHQSAVDSAFDVHGRDGVRLSRWVRVLPGWAFPSQGFSDDPAGIRLLRGVNVGIGGLRWTETVYWPSDRVDGLRQFALEVGDLVIGMDRPWIGGGTRVALVAPEDLPCLLLQRVAKIMPGPNVTTEYLYWAYQAASFRGAVESELTGLSVPHLSGEQIGSHSVPAHGLAQQARVAENLRGSAESIGRAVSALTDSITLLQEFKRSLISAAVSGEFDVSASSGRGVPA